MSLIINFWALISGQVWEVFHVLGVKSLIKFCSKGTVAAASQSAICSCNLFQLYLHKTIKISIRLNPALWQ